MSITSLTFSFVSCYAPQAAAPAAAAERQKGAAASAKTEACDSPRPAGPEKRLVQAMVEVLHELGFGAPAGSATGVATGAAAAAAQTTAAGAATAAAATPPAVAPGASVESAVIPFAHALFEALRQGGGAQAHDSGRADDAAGHRHHHGHHGARHQGYVGMSQRLEALAQTLEAPAAAGSSTAPTRGPSVSITLAVDDGQADAPVSTTDAAAAATPAKNPLLDAFSKLFTALKPLATSAGTETDMAAKLRSFLQTLAQALQPDAASDGHSAAVGGLVNATA